MTRKCQIKCGTVNICCVFYLHSSVFGSKSKLNPQIPHRCVEDMFLIFTPSGKLKCNTFSKITQNPLRVGFPLITSLQIDIQRGNVRLMWWFSPPDCSTSSFFFIYHGCILYFPVHSFKLVFVFLFCFVLSSPCQISMYSFFHNALQVM